MARFVGKETNVGNELLAGLFWLILLVVIVLVILTVWHPIWAHGFLATVGLWDDATGGLGR